VTEGKDAVFMQKSSNKPGCIRCLPSSHSCHRRSVERTSNAAAFCVSPAFLRPARMSSGSGFEKGPFGPLLGWLISETNPAIWAHPADWRTGFDGFLRCITLDNYVPIDGRPFLCLGKRVEADYGTDLAILFSACSCKHFDFLGPCTRGAEGSDLLPMDELYTRIPRNTTSL
jgi:hypothetical protein